MAIPRILQIVGTKAKGILAINTTTGAADADKLISTDAGGKLDPKFLPAGVAPDVVTAIVGEPLGLTEGNFVNVYDEAGTLKAQKATNTDIAKPADGFVLNTVSLGGSVTVYFEGINNKYLGLTLGSELFLGTGGGVTTTSPGAGKLLQYLGKAISASSIQTEIDTEIELTA